MLVCLLLCVANVKFGLGPLNLLRVSLDSYTVYLEQSQFGCEKNTALKLNHKIKSRLMAITVSSIYQITWGLL